jgi:hypothetical protein
LDLRERLGELLSSQSQLVRALLDLLLDLGLGIDQFGVALLVRLDHSVKGIVVLGDIVQARAQLSTQRENASQRPPADAQRHRYGRREPAGWHEVVGKGPAAQETEH